jgi:sec-independent protein translocase protein TatC
MARRRTERLSFLEHLEDLRRKLLWVLAFFAVAFLAAYFGLSAKLVAVLVRQVDLPLYYLSVYEPFLTRVRVSIALAAGASLPLLLVQVARFVLPGLRRVERASFAGITGLFVSLVVALAVLAYRFSPQLLSYFLKTFAAPGVGYQLSIATVVSFYIMLFAADVLIVLMPVAVFLLLKLGLITRQGLRTSRKVLFAVILVVAAVITPPDPFTMLLVAVPLYLLFEVALLLLRAVGRGR